MTLRGSSDTNKGIGPLHLVSAWASENRLTLMLSTTLRNNCTIILRGSVINSWMSHRQSGFTVERLPWARKSKQIFDTTSAACHWMSECLHDVSAIIGGSRVLDTGALT
jgi:hypothetical protein